MVLKTESFQRIKKEYLRFLKSQEILSEPFRDKTGQLKNFSYQFVKILIKSSM